MKDNINIWKKGYNLITKNKEYIHFVIVKKDNINEFFVDGKKVTKYIFNTIAKIAKVNFVFN